ncbi:putative fibritin [Campylobacter phage F341]|nr:putative fibritin [Campylobacter phage F341]
MAIVNYGSSTQKDIIDAMNKLESENMDSTQVNSLIDNKVGPLGSLNTINKTNSVNAINEVNAKTGNLADLGTTAKNTLVDSINELKNDIENIHTLVLKLNSL